MQLKTTRVPEWPRHAWLAASEAGTAEVRCFVGDGVETGPDWLCEAVWAGDYADGDFDRTDVVFGSGVRIRGDSAVFVPSGSTIDRLHSRRVGRRLYVSNSLACLLAYCGGSLRLDFKSYREVFGSIGRGLGRYERDLPTTGGPVRLTYFHNLEWDGTELRDLDKPCGDRRFASFEEYRHFLASSVQALAANAQASGRSHPFGLVSMLSSGYDSSAVTVLAHEAGLKEAFGFDKSREGLDDSGAPLADALGLTFHSFPTAEGVPADVLFLAAGTTEGGDVLFKSGEALLPGRVLFCGFWGDAAFGLDELPADPPYERIDLGGADLGEYRLVVGFIPVPVPFLGGRQVPDIHSIALSPEMEPWSLDRPYNRPIARRIVEEAGVPRGAFATKKRGTLRAPPGPKAFLTAELRRDYFQWLRSRRWDFVRARTVPPSPAWDRLTLMAGIDATKRRRLHKFVTHWAVDRTIERYPKPPQRLW